MTDDENRTEDVVEVESSQTAQAVARDSPDLTQYERAVEPTHYMDEEEGHSEASEEEEEIQPSQCVKRSQRSATPPVDQEQDQEDDECAELLEFCTEANGISVPDHLKWVADHSEFTASLSAGNVRRSRSALGCVSFLPEQDKPDPFVGLSTSHGIIAGFEEYSQSIAEFKPIPMKDQIGIYSIPARDTPTINITSYQLADEKIRPKPLREIREPCEFLGHIKSNFQSVAREEDIKRLEEYSRKALVILSNLDATMSALLTVYPTSTDPDKHFMRGLFRTTQGLQALADIHLMSLHQLVLHRRDTAIHARLRSRTTPVPIAEEHLAQLRYGPCLGTTDLFDRHLIKQIHKEREEQEHAKLQSAALSSVAYHLKHQQSVARPQKRFSSPAATVVQQGEKKKRKLSTQGQAQKVGMMTSTPKPSPSAVAVPQTQIR